MSITTSLRLPPSPKILFQGDSLTQGVGPAPQLYGGARTHTLLEFPTVVPVGNTYRDGAAATILQALGKDHSDGVGGTDIIDMSSRLAAAIAATGVTIDALFVHAGSNGGGSVLGGTQLATYIVTIYNTLMTHNPNAVLVVGCAAGIGCAPPQNPTWDSSVWQPFSTAFAAYQASYAQMAAAVATLPRALAVDCGSLFQGGTNVGGNNVGSDWGYDWLHPTNSGYQKMAKGWTAALRALGVGIRPGTVWV